MSVPPGPAAPDAAPRRLVLVENRVAEARAHYFVQLAAQQHAAREAGWDCRVYLARGSDPAIVEALGARCVHDDPPLWLLTRPAAGASAADAHLWRRSQSVALWDAVRADGIAARDIVMLSTARTGMLAGLDALFRPLAPADWPMVMARIHNHHAGETTADADYAAMLIRQSAQEIAAAPWCARVALLATTDRLARSLERLCWRRVVAPPMPLLTLAPAAVSQRAASAAPTVCLRFNWASSGDMPAAAEALMRAAWARHPQARFIVSAPNWSAQTLSRIGAGDPRVSALGEVASIDDHLAMFARSDVVVLMVGAAAYVENYSAVFAEATAHGCVVVVPDGTLLAEAIDRGEAAGTRFAEAGGADARAAALADALARLPALAERAAAIAVRRREAATGSRYLATLARLADTPAQTRPAYRPGERIDFTDYLDSRRYLADGWGITEAHGCWSQGEQARLTLPLAEPLHGDGVLSAETLALVPGDGVDQRIDIAVNGTALATWTYAARKPGTVAAQRTLRIPAALLAAGTLDITFRIAKPCRPADLGRSADDRRLGIAIAALSLAGADAPADQRTWT